MKPEDWLKQKRLESGYNESCLPINIITEIVLCKYGRVPKGMKHVLSKYASMTRGDADDRLAEILSKAIINILPNDLISLANEVFIGIYPTYEVNGRATTTPNGDKVILLHHGLFLSLSLLADLQALEFERATTNKSIEEGKLIEYIQYIGSLWLPDLKGNFQVSRVNPTTDEFIIYSSVLCTSSMIFVLGHEFGHVIEQHNSYDHNNPGLNHNMEYQADICRKGDGAK